MMRAGLLFVMLAGCQAPGTGGLFNRIELDVTEGPEDNAAAFIDAIDDAKDSVHIALPAGLDTDVTDAVLRAFDRGLEVEVVTDYDRRDDAGIAELIDAEVPVKLADDAVTYFDFNINDDVAWSSDMTFMSHAYVISDGTKLVNATIAGVPDQSGYRVRFHVTSEDLGDDMLLEHNQLFGGTDATELTAFSSPAKSITDYRWQYPTQSELMLEVWLGPQERLTKRVIDSVYNAKASVWVLTNDFANSGLAFALQHKAELGFDVQVVVGPAFESSTPILSSELRDKTPDVPKLQVDEFDEVPTIVLIDYEKAVDGQYHESKAMVISHDLYNAARTYARPGAGLPSEVVSDQLIDGNLFVLTDRYGGPTGQMLDLKEIYDIHHELGGSL